MFLNKKDYLMKIQSKLFNSYVMASKKNARKKKDVEVENYDILQLDEKIKKMIQEETKKLDVYKERYKDIEDKLLENTKGIIPIPYKYKKELEEEINELDKKISDIETNNMFAEYICISQKIITEYLQLVMVPVKVSFFSKVKDDNTSEQKGDLLDKFLDIAKKYVPIKTYKKETAKKLSCCCGNNNPNEFQQTDDTLTCENCGTETPLYTIQTNFKDIDRVNLAQKYKYKRKVHFRDTVNQYQGKQNKKFNPAMYTDVDDWFQRHNLLSIVKVPKGETWSDTRIFHEKHKNITKEHLSMALTETKHNKHYEDINLIYNYFTGIPCPDISDIEAELYEDFDKVAEVYETLDDSDVADRVNFLNGQYVLYQLLRRRGRKVRESDFDLLKTRERRIEHDTIFEKIALLLEWTFESTV